MRDIVGNLVSTIIPVYNRPRLLSEAVNSVLAQTYRPIEILIVDDGSTDDTPAVVSGFVAAHGATVRALRTPNRGPGPAREAGRREARGEFIQYLDSDDRLLPGKFDTQVRALREQPACGVAYGYVRELNGDGSATAEPMRWTGRTLPTLFPWLLVDRWWPTVSPLYRREVCDAVGPWTDLCGSEDWEYDGRVGARRTRLAHCREFVGEYRRHTGPRVSGAPRWMTPPERARFLSLLLQHARDAGVDPLGPEMRHFARWVFLNARQCGAAGNAAAARACFALALAAAGGQTSELRAYRWLAGAVGWCRAGRLAAAWVRATGRRPGPQTLPLSAAATGGPGA